MNNEQTTIAEQESFWSLITKDAISKIEIPIIQRDYAHGREDEKTKKIRNGFLNSLIEAIKGQALELDFIYGGMKDENFQPLDGQQRLTTLYLLHWYIACKTGQLKEPEVQNTFKKFTYETRVSSREFCEELAAKGHEFAPEAEEKNEDGKARTISQRIEDAAWFYLFWKHDPTIQAMLVMLDAIEERLKKESEEELREYWRELTEQNIITFHHLNLENVGLTDDLYIKMNARGKALTDFENFKARFEKHIKGWDEKTKDPTDTFSHKIDTEWTDLFWKYKNEKSQIDDKMLKFMAGIAVNNYASSLTIYEDETEAGNTLNELQNKKKSSSEEAVNRERVEARIRTLAADGKRNANSKGFEFLEPKDFSTFPAFQYLKSCLNIYSKNKQDVDQGYANITFEHLPMWELVQNGKSLFWEFIKESNTTYSQKRTLLCTDTLYFRTRRSRKQ